MNAGSATETTDYGVVGLNESGALAFAVGDQQQSITITANADADSADESVELGFGTLPTGVALGTVSSATVALADDDPLTVVLSGPTETVDDVFEVTITFSEEVSGFTASEVSVGGGTATLSGSGAVYTATITPSASGTVTVDVAAGVAQAQEDAEDNAAAAQFSVEVQFTCSTGAAVADPATDTGLVADCEALRGAKEELAGDGTLNWSADLAMSSWDGVTVGGTPSRVTELGLADEGLNGVVPAALGGLGGLTVVELQGNQFSGCIPTALKTQLDSDTSDLGGLQYCDAGPGKPGAPTVVAAGASSVVVSWEEPVNEGAAISDFDVQYRQGSSGSFTSHSFSSTGSTTSTTITGLLPGRSYAVQVRATSSDGSSPWSESGTGQTDTLAVSYGAGNYTASEGGAVATVTVQLSAAAVEAVTIPLTVSAGAATESDDYVVSGLSGGAVTFAVGATSQTISVTANADADSADESVELGFGTLPTGVGLGTVSSATVALADDDPLTVVLSGPTETVDDVFEVTITFSEEVSGFEASEVSVGGGTATLSGSGAVYTATITPSASGTVTIDVAAAVAQAQEDAEDNAAAAQFSVEVQFTCTTGAAVSDPATDTGLVSDCETLLGAKDELAGEATLNWSVDLAMGSWDGVTVDTASIRVTRLELQSSGLSGTIPTALGSLSTLRRLDLSDNELSGGIPSELGSASALERLYLDGNELSGSIPAALGSLSTLEHLDLGANGLSGAIPTALGSLTLLQSLSLADNELSGNVPSELGNLTALTELYLQDNPLSGCVPTALNGIASASRDLGELSFCDEGPARPLAPTVTTGGTSSVNVAWSEPVDTGVTIDDYDVQYREVDSGAGFSAVSVSGTGTSTSISGLLPGRSYEVQVKANSGTEESSWSPSGVGETGTLTVSYAAGPFAATEGGTAVSVSVALSAAAGQAVTVPITVSPVGTAETGDYTVVGLSSGAVTFAIGEDTKILTVTADQDHDAADEAVELGFGTLPGSVTLGTLTTARVSLTDNDTAPLAVEFGAASYTAVEGGAAVTVAVELNQPALQELSVAITATPRGTTVAGDFAVSAGTVTFAVGDDEKNITITANQDTDASDEVVVLGFGAGVPAGSTATAEVSLEDDDTEAQSAAFGAASYTATEGTGVSVTVELSQAALAEVSVPITVTGQGTTVAGDYEVSGLTSGAVTFAAGEDEQTITVTAAEDADTADETVVLGIGAGMAAGTVATTVVTLEDNDTEGVSYESADYRIAEGQVLTVKVNLEPAASAALTVPITVTAQGSTTATDYLVYGLTNDDALSFATGDDSKSFYIFVWQDADADDEALALGFGTLPAGVSAGAVSSATVAMIDDESTDARVTFNAVSYTASEGSTTATTVTVNLQPAPTAAVAIPITVTPQGTTASGDYTVAGLSNGAVTVAANQLTTTFTVAANEDTDAADEIVELGFGTLPAGTAAGVTATTAVTLSDNDTAAMEVSYGAASYSTTEGSTAVTVTVNLSQGALSELGVPITVAPQGHHGGGRLHGGRPERGTAR